MIYIHWRSDLPRRGRVFPAAASRHPIFKGVCQECDEPLRNGSAIQMIVIGPTGKASGDRALHDAGQWYSAGAIALHHRCADKLTDPELDALAQAYLLIPEGWRTS